jgi:hypothetical protein
MTKVYPLAVLLIGLLLTAVITNAQVDLQEEFKKGKETETGVFVITKDSIKHTGTKFDWNFRTATFKIDDVKYKRRRLPDIIAYQSEESYTAYIPDIKDDAKRLRKGKINFYTYEVVTKWGNSSRTGTPEAKYSRRYMLEKEKNDFYGLSYYTLEKFFSDKPAVLQKYHELFPSRPEGGKPDYNDMSPKNEAILLQQLLLLVEMYNQN